MTINIKVEIETKKDLGKEWKGGNTQGLSADRLKDRNRVQHQYN